MFYDRDDDAVSSADFVDEKVTEGEKLLLAERIRNSEGTAVDLGSRWRGRHGPNVTIVAADLVEQLCISQRWQSRHKQMGVYFHAEKDTASVFSRPAVRRGAVAAPDQVLGNYGRMPRCRSHGA